jgi:hypothetical protein
MNYKVDKSNIPVLWLDTHAITDIASEIHKKEKGKQYEKHIVNAFYELVQLRADSKIIFFESDQLLELAACPNRIDISTKVISQLSRGLRVHDWEVKQTQTILGIDACARGLESATISWNDIYKIDPLEDKSSLGIVVRCDIAIPFRTRQNAS